MKNPGLGQKAKAAGSPHKFGIAGEFKGQDSVSRGTSAIKKKELTYKDVMGDDSETGGVSKKEQRRVKKEERRATKATKKQNKQDIKAYGSTENAERVRAKGAAKEEKYRLENAESLSKQGKKFAVKDESGDVSYRGTNPAWGGGTSMSDIQRGEKPSISGAASRETANKRAKYDAMNPDQQKKYLADKDKEAKSYFANKRAEREASESEAPLTKKKKSALKNYKKGYYGAK